MRLRKILTLVVCLLLLTTNVYSDWFVRTKDGTQTLLDSGSIVTQASPKEIVEQARKNIHPFNFDTHKDKAVWANSIYKLKGYFFADQKAGQIMYYDGKRVREIEGARGILPRISGAGITWIDPKTQDFYFYDRNGIKKLGKTVKSNIDSSDYQQETYMSQNKVTWFEKKGNPFQSEVMVYDTQTGMVTQVTEGNRHESYNIEPIVRGNKVVWEDHRGKESYYTECHLVTGKVRSLTRKQFDSFAK